MIFTSLSYQSWKTTVWNYQRRRSVRWVRDWFDHGFWRYWL